MLDKDPHHHLWDHQGQPGPGRYLIDEIAEDVNSGHNSAPQVLSRILLRAACCMLLLLLLLLLLPLLLPQVLPPTPLTRTPTNLVSHHCCFHHSPHCVQS